MTTQPPDPANPYRRVREEVAALLRGLSWTVHATPPETVQPPCLLILPAKSGWIAPRGQVRLLVRCVAAGTGPGLPALTRIEDMVYQVRGRLRGGGYGPGDTDGPTVGEDRLTADVPLSLRAATY